VAATGSGFSCRLISITWASVKPGSPAAARGAASGRRLASEPWRIARLDRHPEAISSVPILRTPGLPRSRNAQASNSGPATRRRRVTSGGAAAENGQRGARKRGTACIGAEPKVRSARKFVKHTPFSSGGELVPEKQGHDGRNRHPAAPDKVEALCGSGSEQRVMAADPWAKAALGRRRRAALPRKGTPGPEPGRTATWRAEPRLERIGPPQIQATRSMPPEREPAVLWGVRGSQSGGCLLRRLSSASVRAHEVGGCEYRWKRHRVDGRARSFRS